MCAQVHSALCKMNPVVTLRMSSIRGLCFSELDCVKE